MKLHHCSYISILNLQHILVNLVAMAMIKWSDLQMLAHDRGKSPRSFGKCVVTYGRAHDFWYCRFAIGMLFFTVYTVMRICSISLQFNGLTSLILGWRCQVVI